MTTTRTSLTTRMRTWALLAGLTALFVGFGALIGGSWVYVFAIAAVAFNLGAYWFSDRIALRASGARPLADGEWPGLRSEVRSLAQLFEVPEPRLYVIDSDQPNAFATGRNPSHSAVAVTRGLVTLLPAHQVRGVLAHEFGHIRNRDVLVSTIAAVVAAAIASIANILQLSFLFGGGDEEDSGPLGIVGALVAIVVVPVAATLLQLGVSRQREYLADVTAARVLGRGRPLADALENISRATPVLPLATAPAFASLYVANPFGGTAGLASLFSTHPPIAERVRRLRAYDGELGLRLAA
jgi:heat shock protein HtpX